MNALEEISNYRKNKAEPDKGLSLILKGGECLIKNLNKLSEEERKELIQLDDLVEKSYHRSLELGWVHHFGKFDGDK